MKTVSIATVDGVAFADSAAQILQEAWTPPALWYTPEYLSWQLSFPAEIPAVAVAAFDAGEPIGFAAFTPRRLQLGEATRTSAVVSFVGVRPRWRGRGVAADLYARLLSEIAALRVSVLTFGIEQSAGERALLHAYPRSGFAVTPLGSYATYTYLNRGAARSQWTIATTEDPSLLVSAVEQCVRDKKTVWSSPTQAQILHYLRDPRGRELAVLRSGSEVRGAAWIVRMDYRSARGRETVTTVESVFLPHEDVHALVDLLQFAATRLNDEGTPSVVNSPNLQGFDPSALRERGIRQTGHGFNAYLATSAEYPITLDAAGTNLEVI